MARSRSPSRERESHEPEGKTDSGAVSNDVRERPRAVGRPSFRRAAAPQGNGPAFVSRREREQAAMRRLTEQRELQKQQVSHLGTGVTDISHSGSGIGRAAVDDRGRDRGRSSERELGPGRGDRGSKGDVSKNHGQPLISDRELLAIRAAHAGIDLRYKKPPRKNSERTKFVMGWDSKDDTSVTFDGSSLYSQRATVRPMFGRGFIAGVDTHAQLDEARKYVEEQRVQYERLRAQHGSTPAVDAAARQVSELDRKLEQIARTGDSLGKNWRDKTTSEMTTRDWRIFREDFLITVKGTGIPAPLRDWSDAHVDDSISRAISQIGYSEPSPIQRQAIPIGLQARDLIGVAETGSGKTCAFVVPMLQFILQMPRLTKETEQFGPYALVLAPTRELAQQIHEEAVTLAQNTHVRLVSVVGGVPIQEQATQIRQGCEVIVGTPGRMVDLMESRYLILSQCTYVVLDEADRMMDMGFEPQVSQILDYMPVSNLKSENEEEAAEQERATAARVLQGAAVSSLEDRQQVDEGFRPFRTTIMFSATMPPSVEQLSQKYLRRPAIVQVGTVGRAVDRIVQFVKFVKSDDERRRALVRALQEGPPKPWIIFVNAKKSTDSVLQTIESATGARGTTLHSGKNQNAREAAVKAFRDGRYDFLVATDVAGRGISIPGVTHVVNFDCPKNIEDYTHRIGRTGRAGADGQATTLIHEDQNKALLYDLRMALKSTNNAVPRELERHPDAQVRPGSIGPPPGARPMRF